MSRLFLFTLDPKTAQEPSDIAQEIDEKHHAGADGHGQKEECGFGDLVGLGRQKVDRDDPLIELPQKHYKNHQLRSTEVVTMNLIPVLSLMHLRF